MSLLFAESRLQDCEQLRQLFYNRPKISTHNLRHHARRFEAGQAFFQAVAFEEEVLVIQTQQVQNCGVKVVNAHRVFHGLVTEFVRRAVGCAAADSARRPAMM